MFESKSSGELLPYGKPHPEVSLNAYDALKLLPSKCVAIEDSYVGLLAAKAASMKAIIVPDIGEADNKRFAIADHQLRSLEDLPSNYFNRFECNRKRNLNLWGIGRETLVAFAAESSTAGYPRISSRSTVSHKALSPKKEIS